MLMHTKGILVMTPDSAMVLTGKQSLDFSGGVSAEDNFGIGGYDRVMGPNGQAQYWAPNLPAARDVLMAHYDHTYVAPGETGAAAGAARPTRSTATSPTSRTPSPAATSPPSARSSPPTHNPDRKKPFDIRTVMRALSDQDHPVLERWAGMADADTAVVQDVHLGGMAGVPARHRVPVGAAARLPAHRRPGHLHRGHAVPAVVEEDRAGDQRGQRQPAAGGAGEPVRASTARRSRCASCSWSTAPRSAGRSSTSTGPIVFCVISRYHGGAFVVFSKALNPNMTVLALEGSFASVLGGAPAAAVVFSGEVNNRTATDPRVTDLEARGRGGQRRRAGRAERASSPRCGRRSGRRSSARWPPSSTACTASSARSRSARWTPSSAPPSCGRASSRPSSTA